MDPNNLLQSRRLALRTLGTSLVAATLPASNVPAAGINPDAARYASDPWTQARTQLVLNPRLAWFDTAQLGPNSRAVLASQYRAQEALHSDPNGFYEARYTAAAVRDAGEHVSRWLDCTADELCFTRGAVDGLIQCGQALNLQAGDEVVLNAQLPEALRRFWIHEARQRGLVLKTVTLPVPLHNPEEVVAAFTNALGERSRVLVCSHLQPGDGALLPVRELCQLARARGMISMIDGTLTLGAVKFSLRELDCDVYGASLCHWLNGPQQTGVLFVRGDLQTVLQTDYVPRPDTAPTVSRSNWPRLMQRWPDDFIAYAPQFQSVASALAWQENVGRELIEARLRELQLYTRLRLQPLAGVEILTPSQPGMWLQLLSLRAAQRNAAELASWLRNNDNVIVSSFDTLPDGLNALRISLHIYNSHDEIERLGQGLQRALRG